MHLIITLIENSDTFYGFCDMSETEFEENEYFHALHDPVIFTVETNKRELSERKLNNLESDTLDADQQSTSTHSTLNHSANVGDIEKGLVNGNHVCLVALDLLSHARN